ncbi:MBL fold metallo-hydrolase [Veillonella montpellierensis]|uniref:MBL fold metallo-hydrolase n=1 Tax=Veillonella montpellierensis TaxID=187328 RepID=UPI0003F6D44D|nr:MBL fold metallo-hydrolase [Veillonella montpellierensis]
MISIISIVKRPLGLYKANCYVLKKGSVSIIIDPGFHGEQIKAMVGDTTPLAVLLTHGHCDHIAALDDICEYYQIPAYLHKRDHELLHVIRRRPSAYKKLITTACKELDKGELVIGPFHFFIHETPGHSAGSVMIEIEGYLFTGDTIFRNQIGNFDNYNGNQKELKSTLQRVLDWDDRLCILPGHSENSVLGEEKKNIKNFVDKTP